MGSRLGHLPAQRTARVLPRDLPSILLTALSNYFAPVKHQPHLVCFGEFSFLSGKVLPTSHKNIFFTLVLLKSNVSTTHIQRSTENLLLKLHTQWINRYK